LPVALITGILGQDGSLLAELLLDRGYRVVGVVRPGARPSADPRCELVEIDLATTGWATDLIGRVRPDEVYYLAACHRSSEPGLRDDPERMVAVNHAAPLALAHALLTAGRGRLVFAASSQMYTPALPPPRIDERTPRAPATFYGVTKANSLAAIAWLRDHQGLAASTATLFNHESPRRAMSFVSRKITTAAARIAAGLERELELADTSARADFSSARDIVEGLHAMALETEPRDYVLGSGELHTIEELCDVAFKAAGLDYREFVRPTPRTERPALVADTRQIEERLHWQRRHSFEAWIGEMVTADRRRIAEGVRC
jgi:GDPmannose 4,6-dehydratase